MCRLQDSQGKLGGPGNLVAIDETWMTAKNGFAEVFVADKPRAPKLQSWAWWKLIWQVDAALADVCCWRFQAGRRRLCKHMCGIVSYPALWFSLMLTLDTDGLPRKTPATCTGIHIQDGVQGVANTGTISRPQNVSRVKVKASTENCLSVLSVQDAVETRVRRSGEEKMASAWGLEFEAEALAAQGETRFLQAEIHRLLAERASVNLLSMTFAAPPSSLNFGSDVSAQPTTSPLEEMQMYCGLGTQEPQVTSHMELEQQPSQKHRRAEETADDRPAKQPKPESGAGKGKGNPKGRSPHGSGKRPPAHRSTAQPTSNQELQMLRQLVSALCKLCLRHEDALNLHSLDTRLILFCSKHEGKVSMSLRVTMTIDRLHKLLPLENVLHRFHSLRPLTEIMDVGLRAEAAKEA
eukprot:s4456_g11.t1